MNNVAKEKARQLSYKKAALARLNLDVIRDELSEISENCDNVRYFIEDDSETLLAALDGDEEEEYEFKMMFFDLSAKCDRLSEVLYDGYGAEYFDDFLVGVAGNRYELVGYDGYEEDYYSNNDDMLCEEFGYDPRMAYGDKSKFTPKQLRANDVAEKKLNDYLASLSESRFKKAIIVYIELPD